MRDASELIGKVRALVGKSPKNVYCDFNNGCFYNKGKCIDGSIGCLIGQALLELGWLNIYDCLLIDIGTILYNRWDNVKYDSPYIKDILPMLEIICNLTEKNWLATIQMEQDAGWDWADCIKKADELYPLDI